MVVNMARTDEFNLDDGAAMAGQGGRPEVTGACARQHAAHMYGTRWSGDREVYSHQTAACKVVAAPYPWKILQLGMSAGLNPGGDLGVLPDCKTTLSLFQGGRKRKHRGGRKLGTAGHGRLTTTEPDLTDRPN